MVASHKGGAGKTIFTVGLTFCLKAKGLKIANFKKGPDYIDAGWLTAISGRPCRNLDPFLLTDRQNLSVFYQGIQDSPDLVIIEGNRGLFDGVDWQGTCSSASLARLLKCPILLVIDCTKATRSIAALVKGFVEFEKDLTISGVILNNIARPRHETIIRQAIENFVGVPVLGFLPKLKHLPSERHLGLITSQEYHLKFLPLLKEAMESNVDLEKIMEIASKAEPLSIPVLSPLNNEKEGLFRGLKVGIFYDRAFQFYYPENLQILEALGATLVFINALEDRSLPPVDAIYIGGGFPEVYAEALAENESLRKDVFLAGEEGIPIYAECGGLMYLGKEIRWQGKDYPMVGLFPIRFIIEPRPQGHGYVIAKCIHPNPYFPLNSEIRGHEFHYSRAEILQWKEGMNLVFTLSKGTGLSKQKDGLQYKKIFASYIHLHFYAIDYLPVNFLRQAELGLEVNKKNKEGVAYV